MTHFSKKALPILGLGLMLNSQTPQLHAQSIQLTDSTRANRIGSCDSLILKFEELREIKSYEKGEVLLKRVLEICPDNSIYWGKLAYNYLELADNTYSDKKPLSKKDRLSLFEKALEASRKSIQLDSLNLFSYEYMSIGFAGKLSLSSYRQQAILADSVRIYAEKAIEVNPENDNAFHILGRWNYEVANLNWLIKLFSEFFIGVVPEGSYEKAFTYFKKATEINDYPVHHYWLGLNYLKMGNKEEAKNEFLKSINSKSGFHNDDYFRNLSRKELRNNFD